jgi:hypothetical protein
MSKRTGRPTTQCSAASSSLLVFARVRVNPASAALLSSAVLCGHGSRRFLRSFLRVLSRGTRALGKPSFPLTPHKLNRSSKEDASHGRTEVRGGGAHRCRTQHGRRGRTTTRSRYCRICSHAQRLALRFPQPADNEGGTLPHVCTAHTNTPRCATRHYARAPVPGSSFIAAVFRVRQCATPSLLLLVEWTVVQ